MSLPTASWPTGLPSLPDAAAAPRRLPRLVRRIFRLMDALPRGTLEVVLPDGRLRRFPAAGAAPGPRASLQLRDWSVVELAWSRGDIGFGESFIDGGWTSEDPVGVLELFLANRDHVEAVVQGTALGKVLYRLRHLLQRNSRRGARRNIRAHYDLGNAFYRLWLDETMSYSGAWFEGQPDRPLEEAQKAKIRRALRAAGLREGSRVLEIGCGWGALAEIAAREFGAHVTGITLSAEQLAWAQQRIAGLGLTDRCDLRLLDYRDIPTAFGGTCFDAIVSIEMLEAVGEEYWDGYLGIVRSSLRPGGRALVQTIAIRDDLFDQYRRSTDFIQQYIFPGGLLPAPGVLRPRIERAGLEVEEEFSFGRDYARTLHHWRERFLARRGEAGALGFDARFLRTWDFYLAYCEAAFAHGSTDLLQLTLRRPL